MRFDYKDGNAELEITYVEEMIPKPRIVFQIRDRFQGSADFITMSTDNLDALIKCLQEMKGDE